MEGLWKRLQYCFLRDKKIWSVSFGLGLAFTILWSCGAVYSANMQQGIAEKVIRFHVLANSDSQADQALKLRVRDRILEEMRPILSTSQDKEESRVLLQEAFGQIRRAALDEIHSQGYDYEVKVSFVQDAFPMKQYGDLTFPAGIYDALRVEIGQGAGQNWWCVMFPPMCFVDAASGQVTQESKERLEDTLTQEEYTILSAMGEEGNHTPVIKFKIVEWWQEQWTQKGCQKQEHSLLHIAK